MFGKTAGLASDGPSSMIGSENSSRLCIGPMPVPTITPTRSRFSSVSSKAASVSARLPVMTLKSPIRSTRLRSLGFRYDDGSKFTRPASPSKPSVPSL